MRIVKKGLADTELEAVVGGVGSKRVFVKKGEVPNVNVITHRYLDKGEMFKWHKHDDCIEMKYILKGSGIVRDGDGDYAFEAGDFIIFPKGIFHEMENTGDIAVEAVVIKIN